MSLARAVLSGTLTTDPEKRFTSNNIAVTSFNIEVQPVGGKDAPFYVRLTCWRNIAELATENLKKGMIVTAEGRLQINQYETPEGITKRMYELDVTQIYLGQLQGLVPITLEGPFSSATNAPASPVGAYATPPVSPTVPSYASVQPAPAMAPVGSDFTEDDIPF